MLRKNVAGQYLYFALVNASTGAALTGATVAGKRAIDGAAQGSVTGSITEEAGGQYKIALSQADVNGNDIGYLFTATSAIPVSISVVTTAADPTDSVRFGLTALPNAAASAVGGLPVAVDTSGRVDVLKINGTSQTARDLGASVLVGDKTGFSLSAAGIQAVWDALTSALTTVGSIGKLIVTNLDAAITSRTKPADTQARVTLVDTLTTYTSDTPQTGDTFARVGAAGAGLTALGDTRIANLDATVSSRNATTPPTVTAIRAEMDSNSTKLANLDAAVSTRSTYAGADTAGTTTLLSRLTSTRAALLDNLDAAISGVAAAVWASGARTLTSFGTLAADAATAVWGATVRTLSAFGFTVTATADANVALIKAKTDNLPASPAAVGSAMALTAAYDAAKTAGDATAANQATMLTNQTEMITALDDLPTAPTAAANADALLGRNLGGGSDGGRTVTDALRVSRNKVVISATTITVYAEDDTTIAWTGTLTTDPTASPITEVAPV